MWFFWVNNVEAWENFYNQIKDDFPPLVLRMMQLPLYLDDSVCISSWYGVLLMFLTSPATFISSANVMSVFELWVATQSWVYIWNNVGLKRQPWGTPVFSGGCVGAHLDMLREKLYHVLPFFAAHVSNHWCIESLGHQISGSSMCWRTRSLMYFSAVAVNQWCIKCLRHQVTGVSN